jgi:transposase
VEQRDRRDLTRDRTTLVPEWTREVTRVQGGLERANIKLASVASDILGVSGRAILAALSEGRADPATMAEVAQGRVRSKLPLLEQALTGLGRAHHRQFLARPLAHIDFLDEQIETLRADITPLRSEIRATPPTPPPAASVGATSAVGRVAEPASPLPPLTCARAVTVRDTMPGVNQRGGERLVAAWGIAMARFGPAARLAAWSGVVPGNDESARTQRSGTTRKGNRALRTGLTQLAHAAACTKDTSLAALYHRLAARRGKTRAIMAVAHSIVSRACYRLSRHESSHA